MAFRRRLADGGSNATASGGGVAAAPSLTRESVLQGLSTSLEESLGADGAALAASSVSLTWDRGSGLAQIIIYESPALISAESLVQTLSSSAFLSTFTNS